MNRTRSRFHGLPPFATGFIVDPLFRIGCTQAIIYWLVSSCPVNNHKAVTRSTLYMCGLSHQNLPHGSFSSWTWTCICRRAHCRQNTAASTALARGAFIRDLRPTPIIATVVNDSALRTVGPGKHGMSESQLLTHHSRTKVLMTFLLFFPLQSDRRPLAHRVTWF